MDNYKRIDIEDRMSTPYKFMIWCVFLFVVLPLTMVASVFSVTQLDTETYNYDDTGLTNDNSFSFTGTINNSVGYFTNLIFMASDNTARTNIITIKKNGVIIAQKNNTFINGNGEQTILFSDTDYSDFFTNGDTFVIDYTATAGNIYKGIDSKTYDGTYFDFSSQLLPFAGGTGTKDIFTFVVIENVNLGFDSYYPIQNVSSSVTGETLSSFYEYLYTGNVTSYPTKNDGTINGKTFNDGTLTNFADTTRVNHTGYGKALEFDGVDDYVSIPNNNIINSTTDQTLCIWTNTNQYDNNDRIIEKQSNAEWTLAIVNDKYRFAINNAAKSISTTQNVDTSNNWIFICSVVDDTNDFMSIYYNGIISNNISLGGVSISHTNANVYIGSRLGTGFWYNGSIDEVRIWDKALTQAQIQAEMISTSPIVPTIASYSFNEHEGVTAYDTNHIVEGFDNTSKGMAFDGVDDYVRTLSGNSALNPNGFTWSAWLNTPTPSSVVSLMRKTSTEYVMATVNSKVYCAVSGGELYTGSLITANTWNLLTCTYNGSHLSTYLNGVKQGSTLKTAITNTGDLFIGSNSGASQFVLGQMDDVRIYNDSLTSDEVLDLYNNQYFYTSNLVASYDFEEMQNSLIHDRNRQVCVNCYSSEISYNNLLEGTYTTQVYDELSLTSNQAYFTIDITNPVITNNIPAEINTYAFNDSLFSCSDTNLDTCNIAIDSLTQDQNDNFTLVHNGNLSYTITATDLAGNTVNENGTLFVNPYQYFYFTRTNNTPITDFYFNSILYTDYAFFPLYDLGLGSFNLSFDKLGFAVTNVLVTFNTTSTYNLTTNITASKIILSIFDRQTGSILTGLSTITLVATYGYNATTTTGYLNISDVNFLAEEYQLIVSHDGYATESVYFDYDNQETLPVSIYLLNNTATNYGTVTIELTADTGQLIQGAVCKALEWKPSQSAFVSVAQGLTNSNGQTTLNIELNTDLYKFSCEKDGVLVVSAQEIITTTGTTVPLEMPTSVTTDYNIFTTLTYSLTNTTYNSSHDTITFTWSENNGLVAQGCINIYNVKGTRKTLLSSNCATGSTSQKQVVTSINNSYNKLVEGVIIDINGISTKLDSISYKSYYDLSRSLEEYNLDIILPLLAVLIGIAIGLVLSPQNIYISQITVIILIWITAGIVPTVISGTIAVSVTMIAGLMLWGGFKVK